jgi:predicted RNase H-like HicB family nuclease
MNKNKKAKVLEYNVIFTAEDEGGYSVIVPDLPGCFSQGNNFEEAQKNIKEAIKLYLEEEDNILYHITPKHAQKQFTAPITVTVHA